MTATTWDPQVPTQVKEELPEHDLLVFTGPIDAYFASQVSYPARAR